MYEKLKFKETFKKMSCIISQCDTRKGDIVTKSVSELKI